MLQRTIKNYIILFLKKIIVSFIDGFNNAKNIASIFLLISVFLEAWHKNVQVELWLNVFVSMPYCFRIFRVTSLLLFLFILPMLSSPHSQIP